MIRNFDTAGRITSAHDRPWGHLWAPITIGTGGTAWATGVAYKVGDVVTYQSKTYKCAQAHTSQAGWDPVSVPALWTLQP